MFRHSYFLLIVRLSYLKSVLFARIFSLILKKNEGMGGIPQSFGIVGKSKLLDLCVMCIAP